MSLIKRLAVVLATILALVALPAHGEPVDTRPPKPTIQPTSECQQVFLGRGVWSLDKNDISERDKYFGAEHGEVNMDGWQVQENPITLRFYGATMRNLSDVHFEASATQGLKFLSASEFATPGKGALQGNGYTEAATGAGDITLSDDGQKMSLDVDSMVANSSFSFNVAIDVTAEEGISELIVDFVMTGTYPGCEIVEDKVTTGEWSKISSDCDTLTTTWTRLVTTTASKWDPVKEEMVTTSSSELEFETRPMSEAEIAACSSDPTPTPTPRPTPEPTPVPTPEPTPQPTPTKPVTPPSKPGNLPGTGN